MWEKLDTKTVSVKKKVKDLFLVVIKAIDITKNRKVVSSLI